MDKFDRNFAEELKSFCQALNNNTVPPTIQNTEPIVFTPVRIGPLFNLHKRSLPTGMDRIVEMGLTKEEAVAALEGRHKAVVKEDIVIYYDIIAQDATDEEMSIYHNPVDIICENFR